MRTTPKVKRPKNRKELQSMVCERIFKNDPKGIIDIVASCLSQRGEKAKLIIDKKYGMHGVTLHLLLKKRNARIDTISKILAYINLKVMKG